MCNGDYDHSPQGASDSKQRDGLDAMMPLLYAELHRLAEIFLARERPDHTLQATALVHEAYLRLARQYNVNWASRAQILGLGANMMRRILVKHAQSRNALKRNAGVRVPLDDELESIEQGQFGIQELDSALTRLGEIDARQERIVELRFFSGLTVEETASVLEISTATVKREWRTARLWLLRELDRPSE